MPDNYDDIKHLTRPQYDDLHPMSMHDKAAQFSPFAALVGYDDAVAETARLTDSRAELTEEGGRYVEKLGVVRIYDSYSQELVFTDGVRIAVADMSALTFIDEV